MSTAMAWRWVRCSIGDSGALRPHICQCPIWGFAGPSYINGLPACAGILSTKKAILLVLVGPFNGVAAVGRFREHCIPSIAYSWLLLDMSLVSSIFALIAKSMVAWISFQPSFRLSLGPSQIFHLGVKLSSIYQEVRRPPSQFLTLSNGIYQRS